MRVSSQVQPRASLAAQVAAQARPASITPIRPAVLPQSDAPITLVELAERFRSLAKQQGRTVCEMVFVAHRLWLANDWQALGYSDVESFCEAAGVTVRYWDRLALIGERLQNIPLAEAQNIPFAALEALSRVHPSIWNEYAWVEEAKALRTKEFVLLVLKRNAQVGRTLTEPRCALTVRVPLSQHPVIERRLEALRRRQRLSSSAEALTFALESVDRAGLMADTIAEIQNQVEELKHLYDPANLEESEAERDARLADGKSVTDSAMKAQGLLRKIDRMIEGIADALPEEEVPPASDGETVSAV